MGKIHFFARLRKCSQCSHSFMSAEVEQIVLADVINKTKPLQDRIVELEAENSALQAVIEKVRTAIADVKGKILQTRAANKRHGHKRRPGGAQTAARRNNRAAD
jgi:hypothetical protein